MRRGDPITLIANELEVNRSTIYRELRRNHGKRGYHYKEAQEKALKETKLQNPKAKNEQCNDCHYRGETKFSVES